MKKIFLPLLALCCIATASQAQDNLVKKASESANQEGVSGYKFTKIIDLSTTPVENQGNSGTCWSYSTNSFLESEMIKAGKKPLHLAKIYTARKSYEDKADYYVRFDGHLNWGDGGETHQVINMYRKYGIMPESVYTGLIHGQKLNNFTQMQAEIKSTLDSVVKLPIKNPIWKQTVSRELDDNLGAVPATFTYNGKTYTPQTFAKECVGINPNNYTEFISQTNTPYYQKALMTVPDNWDYAWDWNIKPTDLTDIIDNALKKGYTVAWGTDCSEPYFSWPNGVAYVPKDAAEIVGKKISAEARKAMFDGPQPEMTITPENRQLGLDDGATTDDHGMHIVGLAKDQNGKEYYIVKNSWGETNAYKGFLYVTKSYVQYKTTAIMVNNAALPKSIKKQIKIK